MTITTGGPAFPRPAGDYSGTRHGNTAQEGMTLRDYFAAKAMQAYLSRADADLTHRQDHAESAYAAADAMLEVRGQ